MLYTIYILLYLLYIICYLSYVIYYIYIHFRKLTWQWNIDHLKIYFLLKTGIFHCHVSFRECNYIYIYIIRNICFDEDTPWPTRINGSHGSSPSSAPSAWVASGPQQMKLDRVFACHPCYKVWQRCVCRILLLFFLIFCVARWFYNLAIWRYSGAQVGKWCLIPGDVILTRNADRLAMLASLGFDLFRVPNPQVEAAAWREICFPGACFLCHGGMDN